MRVIVLGCGPAGLLAAYACEQKGHEVEVLSKKIESKIPGAVFLHEYVKDIVPAQPDGTIRFFKHGTKRGYAKKVYGNEDADCSWDLFPEGMRPAWSMFLLYQGLWGIYQQRIIDLEIDPSYLKLIVSDHWSDLVISTIPAIALCEKGHDFHSQSIHILDKSARPQLRDGIVYNGSPHDDWYRTSNIFGHQATESTVPFDPKLVKRLGATVSTGYKPLRTNCDCHPRVARIGRFGRWEKGILVHDAYKQTVQLLEALT